MNTTNQSHCPGSLLVSSAYALYLMIHAHKNLPSTKEETKQKDKKETHKNHTRKMRFLNNRTLEFGKGKMSYP